MPSGPDQASRSANDAPVADETTITNLRVSGKLPAALSGQYMRSDPTESTPDLSPRLGERRGDGPRGQPRRWTSHLVPEPLDHDGRRRPEARRRADTRPAHVGDDVVAANLIAFGSSILALGDGALAYELSARLDTIRRVDLAGARRSLAAHSKVDPHTGELHLLTFASFPSQLHVAVSRGALTRTIRSIDDAPSRIRQLELTRDDVVLVADGFVGVTARAGVDTKADLVRDRHGGPPHRGCVRARRDRHRVCHRAVPRPVDVGPSGGNRPLRGARRDAPHVRDEQLAARPARRNASSGLSARARRTSTTCSPEDIAATTSATAAPRASSSSSLIRTAAAPRTAAGSSGSFTTTQRDQAEFVVLDAEAIERPAVATVHIPRRVPTGARGTWISATRPSERTRNLT